MRMPSAMSRAAVGDQAEGEPEKRFVDASPSFSADPQAPETMELGERRCEPCGVAGAAASNGEHEASVADLVS